MTQLDLWTLVTDLSQRSPLSREGIEQALDLVLVPDEELSNQYFAAFKGGSLNLAAGVEIKEVGFRVSLKAPAEHWLLSLDFSGDAVARREILSRYPRLVLSSPPAAGSLDAQTYYSSKDSWGTLSFGFAERDGECLSSVLFAGPEW